MPKAALYIRLSREDREKPETAESDSIKNQQALLIRYCVDNNVDIYDIFWTYLEQFCAAVTENEFLHQSLIKRCKVSNDY